MTNKELLKLAAKAAGIEADNYLFTNDGIWFSFDKTWNPLTDDGDALRLVVKLRLGVTVSKYEVIVTQFGETEAQENIDNDPYAATRRAIVRAAAEIGKEMK